MLPFLFLCSLIRFSCSHMASGALHLRWCICGLLPECVCVRFTFPLIQTSFYEWKQSTPSGKEGPFSGFAHTPKGQFNYTGSQNPNVCRPYLASLAHRSEWDGCPCIAFLTDYKSWFIHDTSTSWGGRSIPTGMAGGINLCNISCFTTQAPP